MYRRVMAKRRRGSHSLSEGAAGGHGAPEVGEEPTESLWVRITEQTRMGDIAVGVC